MGVTAWAPCLADSIWILPRACGINDKMQVFYKELSRDGVKSKVAKSKFDQYKSWKHGRIA